MKTQLVIGNYNYSSWSLRAWLVARWSGLEFDERRLALDTESFDHEVSALSPTGLVPVLHHEGSIVWDSLAISEYLAEHFPRAGLWPAEQATRAQARSLAAEMHGGFASLRKQMPMNCRASDRTVQGDAGLRRDIVRITAAWEQALQSFGGPCLFGPRCIADAMFAPVVFRFATYCVPLSGSLAEYSKHMRGLPDLEEWYARACAEKEVIRGEEVG